MLAIVEAARTARRAAAAAVWLEDRTTREEEVRRSVDVLISKYNEMINLGDARQEETSVEDSAVQEVGGGQRGEKKPRNG